MSVEKIFDQICGLNLIELYGLMNLIKDKFNINDNLLDSLKNNSDGDKSSIKDIKNEKKFRIYINGTTGSKISLIKLVKDILGKDLMSSKKMVDNMPFLIDKEYTKEQIDSIKKRFEDIGCDLSIK